MLTDGRLGLGYAVTAICFFSRLNANRSPCKVRPPGLFCMRVQLRFSQDWLGIRLYQPVFSAAVCQWKLWYCFLLYILRGDRILFVFTLGGVHDTVVLADIIWQAASTGALLAWGIKKWRGRGEAARKWRQVKNWVNREEAGGREKTRRQKGGEEKATLTAPLT